MSMRKLILTIAILFISISPAWAVTLLSSTCGGGGVSGGTTSAINTTGATLIIVSSHMFQLTPVISDSKSNTWTALTAYNNAGLVITQLFYVLNPTTDSSQTFTWSGAIAGGLCVEAFSGTSSFDVQNGNSGGAVTTLSSGSVTPTQDNELVISAVTTDNSGTISVDSGFTIPATLAYSAGNNDGGAMGYKIQTTAGAVNPSWSYSGSASSNGISAAIATFKSTTRASIIINSGTLRSASLGN